NLPGGALRFELQAASSFTDWSRPAASVGLDLEVDTPWWRRPWAAVAVALGLLGALAWLPRARGPRHRGRPRRLDAVGRQQLEAASRQRELLIEQLAYQASHDPLTGLPNRRAGDQALAAALQQADASHGPLCVAIVDVDRFKHVNDRHGHQAGDRVLAQVGLQLQASLRGPGLSVARLGGEEFLVVLGQTPLATAVRLLEAARRDIAAM